MAYVPPYANLSSLKAKFGFPQNDLYQRLRPDIVCSWRSQDVTWIEITVPKDNATNWALMQKLAKYQGVCDAIREDIRLCYGTPADFINLRFSVVVVGALGVIPLATEKVSPTESAKNRWEIRKATVTVTTANRTPNDEDNVEED